MVVVDKIIQLHQDEVVLWEVRPLTLEVVAVDHQVAVVVKIAQNKHRIISVLFYFRILKSNTFVHFFNIFL